MVGSYQHSLGYLLRLPGYLKNSLECHLRSESKLYLVLLKVKGDLKTEESEWLTGYYISNVAVQGASQLISPIALFAAHTEFLS